MKKITLLFLFVAATLSAQETVVNADFSTYTNGALVGQNNWAQYNTNSDRPLTVASGKVTWAGSSTTDGQDAVLLFSNAIPQPSTGMTVVTIDASLSVASAGSSPSYFLALNTLNTNSTTSNYQNARIAAKTLDDGYVFGARVNGQSGYPFAYGTTKLTFNTTYALRAVLKLVAGSSNDTLDLYIGSSFDNLSKEATCAYTTGTVGDPEVGALLISQYGSSTTFESGVSISSLKVTKETPTGFKNATISNINARIVGTNLVLDNATTGSVEIYSVLGSRVKSATLSNGKIDISDLAKGSYIVRCGNDTQKVLY